MICQCCSKENDGFYGSGRFCSSLCARSFSTKAKRSEINDKVSQTFKSKVKNKKFVNCKCCDVLFEKISRSIICSEKCKRKLKSDAAKLSRQTAKSRGTFTGWKSRTKEPSYPEQYFIDLFANEHIVGYIKEYPIGKWFIDFAFVEKKLAIEIDGKQHEYAERKEKDIEKDKFLIENGWKILRIKWKNPINENNKNFLYPQIEKIKENFSD
jgi:very-short-patch-repair endonuclease